MKTRFLFLAYIILMHFAVKAQVKIGNNPTSVNSASLLELETTNQGFVLPRVSIGDVSSSSPLASGLLTGTVVYNTNSSISGGSGTGVYLWNGAKWITISTSANVSYVAWLLNGNSGTNYATNFLGTTDNTSMRFRTNNVQRMIIDSLGSVGIGSNSFNTVNKEKLLVDYGNTTSHTIANYTGSIDDYFQINLQNKSGTANASTDYVATADDGTDSTYYVDMGINSSNFAFSTDNWGGAHDAYLYSNSKNLYIGTQANGSDIIFLVGGGRAKTNAALRVSGVTSNIIVGKGDASDAPVGNILRGPNGFGTNIAGGSLTLQGGSATGTAAGGNLNIYGGNAVSGTIGAVNINTSTNNATNINTGTSSGVITLGNTLNNINLPGQSASSVMLTDAAKNLSSSSPSSNAYLYYNGSNFAWNNATQTTATLNTFTSALNGLTPASGGGTTNYLRADGTWAAPPNPGGTVTSVSVASANGFGGIVANPTTTPQITLTTSANGVLKGNGTAISAATSGVDYTNGTSALGTGILKSTTGTGTITIAAASDFPTLNQNTTGNAATVTTNANLTGPVTSVGNATSVTNNAITNSMLAQIPTQIFKGRISAGTGNVEDLTIAQAKSLLNLTGTNSGDQTITLTGDVTGSGTGSFASTITNSSITNAKLANMAANTIKGNNTGAAAAPIDLTAAQTTAMLNTFTAASKGLVPNSVVSNTTNFLRADGAWAAPAGSGGTVTSVSVASANGFGGTVNTPTTTPQITLSTDQNGILQGDGTAISAATPGEDYTDGTSTLATGILKSTTGTGTITIATASDFPTLNQNTTGNAATVTTNANLTGPVTSAGNATSVTTNAITNTMLAQIPTQIFKGRISAGTGNVEDLTLTQAKSLLGLTGSNTGDQTITLTGDVTGSGTGTFAATIAGNAVTNAKLAQLPTQTFKGRISAGTGVVEDLTIAQAKTLLNLTGTNSGDQTITLTGDVTGSGTGSFVSTIAPGAVSYSKIQNVSATDKVLGRISAGAGPIEEISTTGSGPVVRANSPALNSPTGIVKNDVGLGNVDNTSDINKPVSTAAQNALNLKIDLTQKGANNGVATLDAGGKVPASQLPVGSQVYKGTWNASTNTPTLADGTGTAGWTYRVTTAGTTNFGSGPITFGTGDDVIYNGSVWQRNPSAVDVTSVNSQTGAVVLTTDNISEGSTNRYYTDARARAAHSAVSPLAYNSTTGAFSIPLANTTTNGYLSASDWNTFNSKQTSGNFISALTGDVTATGPGSAATTISNNAVTYAKMQAITANKLLGSGATGTSVGEITLGTGLSFTGTTLNASSSGGTVTGVSVVNANGFAGTVANATTTPAITLTTTASGILKGDGTSISAASVADFPTFNQNTTGNAATVTTNANLTGPVTSVGNATTIVANVITNAMLAQIPTQTFRGRISAGTGNVEDLTVTQATSMLNIFTSALKGLVPASGGGTVNFLRADGTFAAPAPSGSNYRNLVTLGADVINNSATANTLADVTGLSFPVTVGITYRFYVLIPYTSAISTTGSRWTINAPATTLLNYTSRYPSNAAGTTQTTNYASAIGVPTASNANSVTAGSLAVIEGVITPSASGTFQIRFASEIANSAITAKAGATLEWW